MVPESKLGLHYSGRDTLQRRGAHSKRQTSCLCADKQPQVWRSAYRGPDACVGLSELLPYPLSQSSHSVFGGTVEVLVSTRHHPVAPHAGAERRWGNSFTKLLYRKIFDHPCHMDNKKIFMQDKFFTNVPKSKRGQGPGFRHEFT